MKKIICFVLFLVTHIVGVNAMSSSNNDTVLNWEWPANRIIKHKVIVEVFDIRTIKKWVKSPSFAADLPDPMALRGKVLRGDFAGQMEMIKLVLPKVELGDVSKGSKLAIGMIDDKTVVCIAALPLYLNDIEENIWMEQWECK